MRDRVVPHGYRTHVFPRLLGPLPNTLRHFLCLTIAHANLALLISNHHEGRKAEPATTRYHLGATIDVDHFFKQAAVFFLNPAFPGRAFPGPSTPGILR